MKTKSQAVAPAHDGSDPAEAELLLAGHSGGIAAAAFSPDGRTLVTSGADGFLLFWDLPSMELRHAVRWQGRRHSDDEPSITDMAYSPNGALLAASDWYELYLLDPATGRVMRRFSRFNRPFAFSPDSKLIACSAYHPGRDHAFALLDISTGRAVATLGCESSISSVAFSADGEIFGVTSYTSSERWTDSDGSHHSDGAYMATVCDTVTGDILHQWCWEQEIEISAWPQTDGPRLLVFVQNHATLWDAETGSVFETVAPRQRLGNSARWWSQSLTYAPQGRYFLTKFYRLDYPNGQISLWDIGSSEDEPAYEITTPPCDSKIVAFSPDGRSFAATFCDAALNIWKIADQAEFTGKLGIPRVNLQEIAFDDAGTSLRVYLRPGTVRIWNLTIGELSLSEDVNVVGEATSLIESVTDLEGDWLSTAQFLRGMTLRGFFNKIAVFSRDSCFAAARASEVRTDEAHIVNACLWDVVSRRPISEINGLSNTWDFHADFSSDGALLAVSAGPNTIRLLDGRTGELRQELMLPARDDEGRSIDDQAFSFAFSPDGKTVATGHFGFLVYLWDIRSGRRKRRIIVDRDSVNALSFAPDGKSLAVGTSYWRNFLVYGLTRGGRKRIVKGHAGGSGSVTYSPNGRWLASAAGDGTVKLWDAATLECVATLRLLPEGDEYILTTPDGYYSGSEGVERYFRVRRGGEIVRDEALVRRFRRVISFPVS